MAGGGVGCGGGDAGCGEGVDVEGAAGDGAGSEV